MTFVRLGLRRLSTAGWVNAREQGRSVSIRAMSTRSAVDDSAATSSYEASSIQRLDQSLHASQAATPSAQDAADYHHLAVAAASASSREWRGPSLSHKDAHDHVHLARGLEIRVPERPHRAKHFDEFWDRFLDERQQQRDILAEDHDLSLGEFMELVKSELWQHDGNSQRRRSRIQGLLGRLQTPPFDLWTHSLSRATESCPRPFTRTLLARHEAAAPSLSHMPAAMTSATAIAQAPGFDLLLLCWRPGAASVIHDHPKAGCWVKVLKGQMKETRYSVAACRSDAAPGPANDRVHGDAIDHEAGTSFLETSAIAYGPDKVSYIEDSMGYHKMENPDIHEECISLHLYSPGIAECTTWPDASCFSKSVRSSLCLDGSFARQGHGK